MQLSAFQQALSATAVTLGLCSFMLFTYYDGRIQLVGFILFGLAASLMLLSDRLTMYPPFRRTS